jgi:membrane-bound metal-dependent hydrolase YbcI (DUF457 family)
MVFAGHIITGASLGVLCMPERAATRHKAVHLAVFMLLAEIPDLPIRNWGHDQYYISHSLFSNLLFIGIAVILLGFSSTLRTKAGRWPVILCGAAAWLSHLLLDSFYNHAKGAPIFWPFSEGRLSFPIPWLSVLYPPPPPVTPEMIRIFLIELVSFLPLLLLAILIRKYRIIQRLAYDAANAVAKANSELKR